MMLFAVASCFSDSAASAMCLFLELARMTFLAFHDVATFGERSPQLGVAEFDGEPRN